MTWAVEDRVSCIRCQFVCCCLSVLFISLPVASIQSHSFLFDHLPTLFLFCSICSVWLFSVRLLNYSVSWYWNCIPGILTPTSTTIWQVNKHHPQECAIFCLNIRSESLLPPYILLEYPEPTSPIGLAECETVNLYDGNSKLLALTFESIHFSIPWKHKLFKIFKALIF
jgi:hypothetical protein